MAPKTWKAKAVALQKMVAANAKPKAMPKPKMKAGAAGAKGAAAAKAAVAAAKAAAKAAARRLGGGRCGRWCGWSEAMGFRLWRPSPTCSRLRVSATYGWQGA